MKSPRFHCPLPLAPGATLQLPEGAARHAALVLRLKVGEPITLFPGDGGEYVAVLSAINRDRVTVQIGEYSQPERESPLDITLAQALTSNEKMDWIVQKTVELGARRVVPVTMERGMVKLAGERAAKRVQHWQQVAIAACEQCGRNRVPEIGAICDLEDWLPQAAGIIMALSPTGKPLGELALSGQSMALLVGPEGGFSPAEEALLRRHDCHEVRLGPRILRTETAGLAGIAALQALHGDWS